MRATLSRWKKFVFHQKYRFDLGYQFLAFINFTLLVITASDKLRYYTNIPRTYILILVLVPLAFLCVWLFGAFLDKVVRYSQAYNLETASRNPTWQRQQKHMRLVEDQLARIREKLG